MDVAATVDFCAPPFSFPARFGAARRLVASGLRSFRTTSVGRLFDAVAAILGFTRAATFEGQAAIWLEHLARQATGTGADALDFVCTDGMIDYRPALAIAVDARTRGE